MRSSKRSALSRGGAFNFRNRSALANRYTCARVIVAFVCFGAFGWCAEIAWTALYEVGEAVLARRTPDLRLSGHTYLWMFPIYGAGGLTFETVHHALAAWPWPERGAIYMLGCFGVEYASGFVIQLATGKIPWDYSRARWNIHGLIRLDYAPVWFAFGMMLEALERIVVAVTPAVEHVVHS